MFHGRKDFYEKIRPGFNIGGIFGRRPVNGCGINLIGGQATFQPAPAQKIAVQPVPQPVPVPAPLVPLPSAAVIKIQQTIVVLEVKLQNFENQLASLKILLVKLEVAKISFSVI